MQNSYDVVVIGAGNAAMCAALAAQEKGARVAILGGGHGAGPHPLLLSCPLVHPPEEAPSQITSRASCNLRRRATNNRKRGKETPR